MSSVRIGVDVGGTFTDFVLAHSGRGQLYTGKRLTTPDDPSRAIVEGITRLLAEADVPVSDVSGIVHGTTLVTNTVIERTGAKVGLVTTEGFRDAIEIGREIRYDLYDLFLQPAPTLVPRERRLTVAGRIDTHGNELVALDTERVAACARELVEVHGVEAIAVCFIHAYRNPAHEQLAGAIISDLYPQLPLTLSSAVAPEIREFERASTACANAYVQPMMRSYLRALATQLTDMGLTSSLHVMLSGGGIATVEQSGEFPIRLIESGPAAGAMAACHYGALLGESDLISFDMGGTTAKICLIENGKPRRAHEFEAGRVRRFRKGSGIPLKITVVDMIEIGAGGGSLASVDGMGLLKVGPRSAGSVPGPVCYGQGGTEAAVTDADLLLGYLNPDYFLGGEMPLAHEQLEDVIVNRLGAQLGTDRDQTASGIHEVVNENMAAATRRYMAEKGRDPRRYAMIAFGGAGPVHAYGLARRLKIDRIIIPAGAGVTSALGFLVAPPAVDDVRSYVSNLDKLDFAFVNHLFSEMEASATAQLLEAGARVDEIVFERSADMRHVGQGFEISVPVPNDVLSGEHLAQLTERFFQSYAAVFERRVEDVAIETMSWRLQASAPAPRVATTFSQVGGGADAQDGIATASGGINAHKGERKIYMADFGWVTAQVYDRYALVSGALISGPAVFEERESTTVIGPDATAKVDSLANIIIEISTQKTPAT